MKNFFKIYVPVICVYFVVSLPLLLGHALLPDITRGNAIYGLIIIPYAYFITYRFYVWLNNDK